MAGSVVVTPTDLGSGVTKYTVVWTSDASGDVNSNTFAVKMGTTIGVCFKPSAGGTQPTDLYDVDLIDSNDISMFDDGAGSSIGTNLSNTLSSHKVPLEGLTGVTIYRRWHQGGDVELVVTNAGDAKVGTVLVYIISGVL